MTETVCSPAHPYVVQRYPLASRGRQRVAMLGVGAVPLIGAIWFTLTIPAGDPNPAGFLYMLAALVLGVTVLRQGAYTVSASVAGVRYAGLFVNRWIPWERIDRFATHWQELDDQSRRRVLVVLRDAPPQPLNPGFTRWPMSPAEVDRVARWLDEWARYQQGPAGAPVPRLPDVRR